MIDLELYNKLLHANHFTILDSYVKANSVLNGSNTALCSVSGGSDSDIMLDIILPSILTPNDIRRTEYFKTKSQKRGEQGRKTSG